MTLNFSWKEKYLPETLRAPISCFNICSWLSFCGSSRDAPNSSLYCWDITSTASPTCLWNSRTACNRTHQQREVRKRRWLYGLPCVCDKAFTFSALFGPSGGRGLGGISAFNLQGEKYTLTHLKLNLLLGVKQCMLKVEQMISFGVDCY